MTQFIGVLLQCGDGRPLPEERAQGKNHAQRVARKRERKDGGETSARAACRINELKRIHQDGDAESAARLDHALRVRLKERTDPRGTRREREPAESEDPSAQDQMSKSRQTECRPAREKNLAAAIFRVFGLFRQNPAGMDPCLMWRQQEPLCLRRSSAKWKAS